MSRRQDIQTAEGVALDYRGYGVLHKVDKIAPTNGVLGYAPGCLWMNLVGAPPGTPISYRNIGGNGFVVGGGVTNPGALWVIDDPSAAAQFQMGSATTGFFASGGTSYRNVFATGQAPSAAGLKKCVDLYNLPANALDGVGFREVTVTAGGNVTGSTACTATININATAPTVGGTISTGTDIATTGALTSAGEGWFLEATFFWAATGNVVYQEEATIGGTTHGGVGQATELAVTTTAPLPIIITINATTTAANMTLWWWTVSFNN